MKRFTLALLALCAAVGMTGCSSADKALSGAVPGSNFVFAAQVVLAGVVQAMDRSGEYLISPRTIDSAGIINLALGQPPGTQLPRNIILAAIAGGTEQQANLRLIVYDTNDGSELGSIANVQGFHFAASPKSGVCVAELQIDSTGGGDYSLDDGHLYAFGKVGINLATLNIKVTASLVGHVDLTSASTPVTLMVTKGKLIVTGPPIGSLVAVRAQ